MNGHAGCLVENNDILILIDNIQWQVYGRDLFRRSLLIDLDAQVVAGMDIVLHIDKLTVEQDVLRHALDECQILSGEALPP